MPRAFGILGGTFNPPHLGHLAAARAALGDLALDRVLLIPTHTSPHKPAEDDPGPEARLEMCRVAVAGERGLEASAIEIERGGPSYTVDTLRALHASDLDAQLTLIVGADMARTLPAWHESRELLGLARIAVAGRDGIDREEIERALAQAGAEPPSFLHMPHVDVSSSLVRERIAAGEDVSDLVGGPVADYIETHGLYRDADGICSQLPTGDGARGTGGGARDATARSA